MHNAIIKDYLGARKQAGTQSPESFHAWGLLSAAAAVAARRVWFRRGHLVTFPNMIILLVGDPGARKSTAISDAKNLVTDIEHVMFGPVDVSGYKQGLLKAMSDPSLNKRNSQIVDDFGTPEFDGNVFDMDLNAPVGGLDIALRPGERNAIWCCASEAANFFGIKKFELASALVELIDGEPYSYMTKRGGVNLPEPCLNLIGGATPLNIATMFADGLIEQGLITRTMLVYGEQQGTDYWPAEPDAKAFDRFSHVLMQISEMSGEMGYTAAFRKAFNDVMNSVSGLKDVRFTHYKRRRGTWHMVKAAMCLAMLRGSMTIDVCDLEDAEELINRAERRMPEAIGEWGMTPLAVARHRTLATLKEASEPLTIVELLARTGKDCSVRDVRVATREFVEQGLVEVISIKDSRGTPAQHFVAKTITDETIVDIKHYKPRAGEFLIEEVKGIPLPKEKSTKEVELFSQAPKVRDNKKPLTLAEMLTANKH